MRQRQRCCLARITTPRCQDFLCGDEREKERETERERDRETETDRERNRERDRERETDRKTENQSALINLCHSSETTKTSGIS